MSVPAPQVRAARGFLRSKLKAGTSDVSPKLFASAAGELGIGFSGVAAVLARLYAGGQNQSFYREQALEQEMANE